MVFPDNYTPSDSHAPCSDTTHLNFLFDGV